MHVRTARLWEVRSPMILVHFFFICTCVVLLFIPDTENGLDTSIWFAYAVTAAYMSVKLEGRVQLHQ